ncbi:MAG: pentapeptide repeat-containing protein, partial [Myxococcales bacterium]|nr:pentapeptide repeat-containing protein [Myxococcales bacterium]
EWPGAPPKDAVRLGPERNLEGYLQGQMILEGWDLHAIRVEEYNMMEGIRLARANLRGAWMRGALLSRADLRDCDLSGVELESAELRGADLRGADLRDANLRACDLSGANLSGARLDGASYDEDTLWPDAEAPPGAVLVPLA